MLGDRGWERRCESWGTATCHVASAQVHQVREGEKARPALGRWWVAERAPGKVALALVWGSQGGGACVAVHRDACYRADHSVPVLAVAGTYPRGCRPTDDAATARTQRQRAEQAVQGLAAAVAGVVRPTEVLRAHADRELGMH